MSRNGWLDFRVLITLILTAAVVSCGGAPATETTDGGAVTTSAVATSDSATTTIADTSTSSAVTAQDLGKIVVATDTYPDTEAINIVAVEMLQQLGYET